VNDMYNNVFMLVFY